MPTTPKHAWMVRAGSDNVLAQLSYEKKAVAIGWPELGNVSDLTKRIQFRDRYWEKLPTDSEKRAQVNADQLYRFILEIKPGDYVLSYDKANREIFIGLAEGGYEFNTSLFAEAGTYYHTRHINWLKRVSRDVFSEPARNSMGSTLTVFNLDTYLDEIGGIANTKGTAPAVPTPLPETQLPPEETVDDIEARYKELISDRVSSLDPYEFQDLVAAVLRAMGLRAVSVPPGPDGGVDIIAHPDAFGFGQPRIKVQVKHKSGPSGSPDIQRFSATIRAGESGLFVSTGDFSKDAKMRAEEKSIKLLNRDAFIELLVEHYDTLESEFKAKIPLRRIWVLSK